MVVFASPLIEAVPGVEVFIPMAGGAASSATGKAFYLRIASVIGMSATKSSMTIPVIIVIIHTININYRQGVSVIETKTIF